MQETTGRNGTPRNKRTVWNVKTVPFPGAHFATYPTNLIEPCIKASKEPRDMVLDPFFGSGTVGEVCLKLGRNIVGIEINDEYASIAKKRLGWE